MTVCVVKGCHNCSQKPKKDLKITFHQFPSDPIIAERWIDIIKLNRNDSSWKPSKHTKICSIHFDDSEKYITKGGTSRFHRGAIPTKAIPIFTERRIELNADDRKDNHMTNPLRCQPVTAVGDGNTTLDSSLEEGLDYVFDTPKELLLRSKLHKKTLIVQKSIKKIKILRQKNRRLIKRNLNLRHILKSMREGKSPDKKPDTIEKLLTPASMLLVGKEREGDIL